MTLPLQPNLVGLPLAPAQCVVDPAKDMLVARAIADSADNIHDSLILPRYFERFQQWIQNTDLNTVIGLSDYPVTDFSAGTSEAFDKFYLKHNQRRFRCFRGEYLYHKLSWENQNRSWAYLDDEPLAVNDAVVISLPFADTGDQHPGYTNVFLDQCEELGIPVLLDCAFFGVCGEILFDFTHPAISEICFSLSKAFPVSTLRIGIRFSRENDNDSLTVYNSTQYVNLLAAAVGTRLMNQQRADEIWRRYRLQQIAWCKEHDLVPSNTVIFGLDRKNLYPQYSRGYPHSNRICFAKYFNQGLLPSL
jgi:hypothetical protein